MHPEQEPKLKDSFGRFAVPDVTVKDIDREKYPHFHEANAIYVTQETGDAIFVPSGWYHQVKNIEDTISINHNWFNGYNVREIWGFFKREYAAVEHELEDLKEIGLVGREFVDQCQLVMLANTGINYVEFRELLYAKTTELLSQHQKPDDSTTFVGRHDLLLHLGYVSPSKPQLGGLSLTKDGIPLLSMAAKTPEEEIAELRQANDELYREHAHEKAQMQAAVEQERLRTTELLQTIEAIAEENGQWRESYAALEEAKRYAEEQIEETRRYAEEQSAAEKAELEEQISQLEESVKSCTAQMVDDLAELERLRASDTSHEQQEAELQRQLDERDDRFAQLSAEYDSLRIQYDQLQQAQEDARRSHGDEVAAKEQELANGSSKIEELRTQVANLESQLKAASDVREVNQNALLRRAEQQAQEKQEQLNEVNGRVNALENELALMSLTGSGGNDYAARIRGLHQEVFVKSEQLVQQGEKHLRVAEMLDKTKTELAQLREEVGIVRRTLLRGIGLDPTIASQDANIDDMLYQHVKLEELVRLRLKALEHEWQLAGGSLVSSSADSATEPAQDGGEASSCHLPNVDNFSALDALGLGGAGRLEREMRVLRSRNKRLIERTERLENELDAAQAGLRDMQSMREKVVEMVGRERVEKELRAKSELANKELGEKVAALSEHVEKLMVHLKHEAAAKTRAVEAQRRVDKELIDAKDKLAAATRKHAAQDAKVAELEQGARILEDQLRLMDEKFIDVRNKLDWTRSAARKENKQLSAELRSLRMKWQMASDSGVLAGLPDWASTASMPRFSKKSPLGASSSEPRLPTPKASNNGLSPVVAAVVQDALAIGNGARVKFEIPKLPQPESDAVHVSAAWWKHLFNSEQLTSSLSSRPERNCQASLVTMLRLLTALAVLLPFATSIAAVRDRGPLFNGSLVVRSLDVEGYEAMLSDSESVWIVDYYSSWCAHCRMFAPEWEKVGAFYADSRTVQVGAVNCNEHKDVCQQEEVHAYPAVKAHHVPLGSSEKVNMEVRGRKKLKPVVTWVEEVLAEHGIKSGMDISTITEENKLRRNEQDDPETATPKLDDTSIQMKYNRLHDAGKAAMLALENSLFIGVPVLEGERYDAAMKFVNALAAAFPVEGNRQTIEKLAGAMKQQQAWPFAEWTELIRKWRVAAKETSFPTDLFDSRGDEDSGWGVCRTYTCGLWTLFHSMTVKDLTLSDSWKSSDTMAAIRLYMKFFFGCEECRQHFMEANPASVVDKLAANDKNGPHAVAMWALGMHNSVNKRLNRDQWPKISDCPGCYIDIGGPVSIGMSLIHEDGMVSYVTSVYGHEDRAVFDEIITTAKHLDNGNLGAAIDAFMAFLSVVFAGSCWLLKGATVDATLDLGDRGDLRRVVHNRLRLPRCISRCKPTSRVPAVTANPRQPRDHPTCAAGLFLHSLPVESISLLMILFTIAKSYLHVFFVVYSTFWYGESWWRFVYPVRFAMCYLTGKAVLSRCHAYLNPVRQFAFLCYLQITCILLGAAGIIQIAETMDGTLSVKNLGEWTFFNSFFNSVMTFVTIDKPPSENNLSKIFVGVLVCIFILVIPYQLSNVMDLSNSVSAYEEASYKPSSNSRHVVLCGDLTASRISHFFHEIFHNDHDFVGVHVIVLSEDPPATSLKALLLDPFFAKRVWFIQGSLLDIDDAKRAACDSADAIFMLTDRKGDEDFSVSDHRTLMRVLAAKRQAPKAHIFAQLHRSVHCQLVRDMGVQNVLCLSEVALSLLGQNCICPGFSTFMYSLTSTSSFDDDNDEGLGSDAKRTNRCQAIDNGEGSWVDRYLLGASHEVYVVELPPASVIAGKTFSELASLAYSHCNGIIVFAVADGPRGRVVLNPGDTYTCVGSETAYVIAQTQADASALTEMSPNVSMPLAWREMQVSSPSSLVRGESSLSDNHNAPLKRHQARFEHWQFGDYEHPEPEKETEEENASEKPPVKKTSKSPEDAVINDVEELGFGVAPIVICVTTETAFSNDLEHLIGPLRERSLKQYHPVIILTAKLPDDDLYDGFSHFPDVHFVVGDPYRHKTLNRAGISDAYRVLILGTSTSASDNDSELLQDAESIALHKFITSFIGVKKAPRVITEVGNRASVHFVAQNLLANGWFPGSGDDNELTMFSSSETFSRNFFLSPAFTSGLTYSTSLCDSLLINQFFNGRIKNILGEFMFTSRASAAWAALRGDKSKSDLQRSSLFAVEVPLDFVGRSFEYAFHYLLSSDDILVIGLYRCHPYMNAAGDKESKARIEVPEKERSVPFGYVYVNPQPFEVITGDDMLYVLSDKQPCWAKTQEA
ncbi:unnamed protein product [Phytophthora lilii]|uniref:Sulfhydryl oxidase n=1 Tax=Phytophthora lilii TaxID=2077276 RepID=A0A9W6TAJ8_9STRA|nr:unnamed protein product [Phytophthora lilii]